MSTGLYFRPMSYLLSHKSRNDFIRCSCFRLRNSLFVNATYKRVSERTFRKTVDVLTDLWQINKDEVTSGELLGSCASASVYKASYRNLTVTVKKMMGEGLPKSIEDFETMIMFMRTVRHKNIILFIGAEKS